MSTIYDPTSLPKNDNINRFSYCMDVLDTMLIQKGKMIAFYGRLEFTSLGSGLLDMLVKEAFNAPLHIHDFVSVRGAGQLILGDRGNDIAGYDLDGANLTVRAKNLLAFQPTLHCQESTLPGFLTLVGTGKALASSNGPVHFMDLPCRVDEQAILGWADCPTPSYRYDYEYIRGVLSATGALMGISLSGEEKQMDFFGKGSVLVQSSELELQGRGMLAAVLAALPSLQKSELAELAAAATKARGR